ncbi:MAG: DNA gyrase C-terminal beta-propeller domain-containing protein, partial [Chloroflexota bacterium]
VGISARSVETHLSQLRTEPDDEILLISNQGRAWRVPVGQIPQKAKLSELGLDKREHLVGGGVVNNNDHCVVMCTRGGTIKRTNIEDVGSSMWSQIIGLNEGDEVLCAGLGDDNLEVMLFSEGGKAIRFAAGQVNPQATSTAKGVVGMKIKKGDRLVSGSIFQSEPEREIVLVSQTGFVKRVPMELFPLQGRGGQGVQSLEITKVTSKVAAATVAITRATMCDIISAEGLRQRIDLDYVPVVDRRKRGESLVQLESVATVVALA